MNEEIIEEISVSGIGERYRVFRIVNPLARLMS
jgi:hypothetical protein